MPVYHTRRWGSGRGAHLTNWHKAAESLGAITRLTEELNKIAWVLAHRVEHSELNLSSQSISQKLSGIATVLEGLPAQVADAFSKESLPDSSAAEEAFRTARQAEAKTASADSTTTTEASTYERKDITGKRFRACARDGKVFLIYRKRGHLPIWIGFELDFSGSANSNSVPLYLPSQASAERFVYGD